jgi:hypothetical protein
MISEANKQAIEAAGLSFILGMKIPDIPYVVAQWRRDHPDAQIEDGQIFTQPWPAGTTGNRRDQTIYYQYRADRARRTLRGIDQQVVNRQLETKARALAGLKGYATNLDPNVAAAQFVIGAYHQLFQIEKSFRMSKHDLRARPIYHHTRESIDAHLTIVFAALATTRWIEDKTGWSIKKFVTTARRYRTVHIRAGDQTITAADPLPNDLRDVLKQIHSRKDAH